MKIPNMLGKTFGHLTVTSYVGLNRHRKAVWECRCSCPKYYCAKIVRVVGSALRGGNTKSCSKGPSVTPEDFAARFWSKVQKTRSCWIWRGAGRNSDKPYGHLRMQNGHWTGAHIFAYNLVIGPVPKGKELDHTCRNTLCVNPAHLEPVTHRMNVIDRGQGPFAQRARQTHCKYGHEFTLENTHIHKSRRVRICRTCHNARSKAAKKLERQNETPEQRTKRLSYFKAIRQTIYYKERFNEYRRKRRAAKKALGAS